MGEEFKEKELSKWIRLPIALVLFLILLLCAAGSFTIIIYPPENNPIFALLLGSFMMLACLWGLKKTICMFVGVKTKGGLLSPFELRVIAVIFLAMPFSIFFTGNYKENDYLVIIQAIVYISIFFILIGLAKYRSRR